MPTSKEQLLEIIQNGRQFLSALEQFAATNFPNDDDDDNETTTLLNRILRDGESGRFEDAERFTENGGGQNKNEKTIAPSTTAAKKSAASVDAANQASHHSEEYPAGARAPNTNTREDNVARNPTDPTPPAKRKRASCQFPRRPVLGAIAQFCAKTGTVLAHYRSLAEAAESISESLPSTNYLTCKSAIAGVISGRRKSPIYTYKGWYFRVIGDTTTPMPTFPITKQSKRPEATKAAQLDPSVTAEDSGQNAVSTLPAAYMANCSTGLPAPLLQFCARTGKQLRRFETAAAATKFLASSIPGTNEGQFRSAISHILRGCKKRPSYRGFYFRNANDIMTPFPDFPIPGTPAEWRDTALGRRQMEEQRKKAGAPIGTAAATQANPTINAGQKRKRDAQSTVTPGTHDAKYNRGIPVLQFCANTGKKLGHFDSAKAAAQFLASSIPGTKEGNFTTAISSIIRGQQKRPVYKGFYFRRADDITSAFPKFPIR